MAKKKIVDVIPHQTGVLFELLDPRETATHNLIVPDNQKENKEPPQAIILKLGASIDETTTEFKVGARVILVGNYIPLPQFAGASRKRGICDFINLKCVLVEAEDE